MNFNSSDKNFSWWPLGGLGEVGMNCMVFRFGETVLPVDAGILFADQNDFGIEALFPDVTSLIEAHCPKHWLITHGHEDHIGAVPYILKAFEQQGARPPHFYAPPFAAELIRERLLDEARIHNGKRFLDLIVTVEPDTMLHLDGVDVYFMETRHSIPDACSLAFHWKSALGDLRIVHTSDFKLDEHSFEDGVKTVALYDVFKDVRPDLLFIDSTNAEREGHSVSEIDVIPGLEKLISDASGRVYVTLFSSNVYRIAEIMRLAEKAGRFVCLAGRSLQGAMSKATHLKMFARSVPEINGVHWIDSSDINKHPPHLQLIICSGSQGENRSALMRLASGMHTDFLIEKGDAVIFSSKTIPGNEKAISKIINGILRQGAKVFWGDLVRAMGIGPIHASGHARRDEIKAVASRLKPHFIVPVHGELRQLESSAEMLRETGLAWGLERGHVLVLENGTRIHFEASDDRVGPHSKWRLCRIEKPSGYLPRMLRFEKFVSPSGDPFLKVRKRAALGGIVSGWIDAQGRVSAHVFGLCPQSAPLISEEVVEKWLMFQYRDLKSQRAFDGSDRALENDLADELARHIRRLCGVRPFTIVHVIGS